MRDSQSPDWALLTSYLAGECSSAEHDVVQAWLGADPEHGRVLRQVEAAWHGVRPVTLPQLDTTQRTHDLFARLSISPDRANQARPPRLRMVEHRATSARTPAMRPPSFARRAALFASAAGVALTVGLAAHFIASTSHTAPRTYSTPAGRRATITLADGSSILLGPATQLSISTNGGTDVTVRGEALFTVHHQPDRPFTVHAGHTVARVLGTTFSVRHYAADRAARVVVVDGRVAVHTEPPRRGVRGQVLSANMMSVIADSGDILVAPHIAVDEYTALANDRLVFRSTRVADVITELARAYDIVIRVPDTTLARHTVTAAVPVTRWSAADAVEFIATMLDAHSVQSGRVFTISAGRPAPHAQPKSLSPLPQDSHYGR